MTDAIEAGARAIKSLPLSIGGYGAFIPEEVSERMAKACIEAAIASGALVPASAVAEVRERCALWLAMESDRYEREVGIAYTRELRASRGAKASVLRDAVKSIRQLDIAPASGDYVVVPRDPTEAMVDAACGAWVNLHPSFEGEKPRPTAGEVAIAIFKAMLHAASSNGGEK